ncbi:hypothetical protein [Roseateles chitosanitabidus]|jgi:hypothetical protein|uniref:hypothetical protein n=1 Tax=Roseateles chitosanitabidus TaxID=65048 RepID=UPI00082DCE23|nr:hypothetical protein [Roseateles chitosanitabidus]
MNARRFARSLGLYDRYDRHRSNPATSVIAAEAPDLGLSEVRQLDKRRVDIGFESYSPNDVPEFQGALHAPRLLEGASR